MLQTGCWRHHLPAPVSIPRNQSSGSFRLTSCLNIADITEKNSSHAQPTNQPTCILGATLTACIARVAAPRDRRITAVALQPLLRPFKLSLVHAGYCDARPEDSPYNKLSSGSSCQCRNQQCNAMRQAVIMPGRRGDAAYHRHNVSHYVSFEFQFQASAEWSQSIALLYFKF